MTRMPVPIGEAHRYPAWRRPVALLILMAAGMPLSFATWSALLNNFVIEAAGFDGSDIGWLQTVREVPGFAAIGVIAVLLLVREQTLALISLAVLGAATAVTAQFPTFGGLLITTFIGSLGFHYYETVNQSLQLQWLKVENAPKVLGWILAAGSAASLAAYGAIVLTWKTLGLSYDTVYLAAGAGTVLIALFAWIAYPRWEAPTRQSRRMVLRRRYWLYYALQFLGGRAAADLHRLRRLHDGGEVRLHRAPGDHAVPDQLRGEHVVRAGRRTDDPAVRGAGGAGDRVCGADRRLRGLCGHLHVRLEPLGGGGAVRARPSAVRDGLRPEDLFPEDRGSG